MLSLALDHAHGGGAYNAGSERSKHEKENDGIKERDNHAGNGLAARLLEQADKRAYSADKPGGRAQEGNGDESGEYADDGEDQANRGGCVFLGSVVVHDGDAAIGNWSGGDAAIGSWRNGDAVAGSRRCDGIIVEFASTLVAELGFRR